MATAKQQSSRTADVFQPQLNPTTHMQVAAETPINDTTIPTAQMTGCQTKIDDTEYLSPIFTNQSTDSYGQPIDGGLTPKTDTTKGDKLNVEMTKTGSRLITGILGKIRDHLPWVSKIYAFDGLVHDLISFLPPLYGTFNIPDPANPGSTIPAPGTPDKTVKGFGFWVWRRASTTLPAAGEGSQSTETMAGYTDPAYNTSALDIDPTTKALYVKWNPTDLKLDDQGRLDLSDAVKAELGGGGGGSSGPGAAVYGITSSAVFTDPPTGVYVPWDHINRGDDQYLDPANTDGLTIPADGGGDYAIDCQLSVYAGNGVSSTAFELDYTITVELWRAGSSIWSVADQDQYLEGNSTTDKQNANPELRVSIPVPATQAGDVIKLGIVAIITYYDGTHPSGSVHVNNDDNLTWIGISPVGQGSGVTGNQVRLSLGLGDSGTAGNWLYDVSHTNPYMECTDSTLPFIADHDPDSWWNAATQRLTVPTGKGGTYLLDWLWDWELVEGTGTGATLAAATLSFGTAATPDRVYVGEVTDTGGAFTAGVHHDELGMVGRILTLADGNSFQPVITATMPWQTLSDHMTLTLIKLS